MIRLALNEDGAYCINGDGLPIDCEWKIKTLDFSYEKNEALLWINPGKISSGYGIVGLH
jgi:hypothetical protein